MLIVDLPVRPVLGTVGRACGGTGMLTPSTSCRPTIPADYATTLHDEMLVSCRSTATAQHVERGPSYSPLTCLCIRPDNCARPACLRARRSIGSFAGCNRPVPTSYPRRLLHYQRRAYMMSPGVLTVPTPPVRVCDDGEAHRRYWDLGKVYEWSKVRTESPVMGDLLIHFA